MKIDWKHLSQTSGYKSLKAAMIRDIQEAQKEKERWGRSMRNKAEFHRKFKWVIERAKNHSFHKNKPIHEVLNEWEEERTFWWLNYYQDYQQQKLKGKNL